MIKRLFLLTLVIPVILLNSYAADVQPAVQPQTFSSEEISAFEKKFKEIEVNLNYLKEKTVEYNEIITLYSDAEKFFRELKTSPDIKDINLARQHLKTKLEILDEKSKQRASYIKRMEFMYQAMIVFGMISVIVMVSYSIYMYGRRK